jgi:PAS domain S-box-containing protein
MSARDTVESTPPGTRAAVGSRESGTFRDAIAIVALVGAVTLLHMLPMDVRAEIPLHMFYKRLYYIPIIYAGLAFGRRGGLLTASAAGLLWALHAHMTPELGGLFGNDIDNVYEIVMFIAIGLLFGWLRDLEEARTRDLRQVSTQLEDAYRTLEERAIQFRNVQEYTQSILRSITAAVITVGPDGLIATANPAAERMLSRPESDVVPRRISALFAEDGGLDEDIMKVLEGRLPRLVRDMRLVTRGGRVLHAQVSTSRMRDVDGRVLGAVVTLEDVSEVKALTDQLIRADRLAAMGELTAGVAHEVRNPLGIIRASVQLVEESGAERERVLQATGVIKQEIDRLDKVIKALLDFGRPSKPHRVLTDIGPVIDDVVLFTSQFAGRSRVSIRAEGTKGLPLVLADADQLKQVFVNLVSNAVQAMENRGGTIRLMPSNDDGFVSIAVIDDGPGIPPGDLRKIFDPFYSTRDDGTGLGLTMVHRIVDEHDGHIEVKSTLGEGASFIVSLPIARSAEEAS